MTLGERIMTLRMERQMSQSDLAEALDVSRQSISKWETDSSVPELDKLIMLCEIFGVSMDMLVRGLEPEKKTETERLQAEPTPPQQVVHVVKFETRKIIGILLFIGSLVCMLLGAFAGDLIAGFFLAVPFIACGSICLACKKRAGLWCAWVVGILGDWFLSYATGAGRGMVIAFLKGYVEFNINVTIGLVRLVLIAALVLFTMYSFRNEEFRPFAGRNKWLAVGWLGYVILHFAFSLILQHWAETVNFVVGRTYSIIRISGQQLLFIMLVILLIWTYHWWKERRSSQRQTS